MFGWLDKKTFEDHAKSDKKQFKRGREEFSAIREALSSHDARVDSFHEENTAMIMGIQSQLKTSQESIEELLKLKPDIMAGVAADHDRVWRKKIFWRVVQSIIGTVVTISGLVPLFLWLSSLKISVHSG